MRTFVHITDSHFRQKSPINRTDDILESLFAKLECSLQYAEECNAHIIHTGDMFHSPSVPDFIATKIVKLFKKYKRECYYIIGNHDVTGGNCDTYDFSKIGLLSQYEWFHLLDGNPKIFPECNLVGYNFSKEMECPELIDVLKDIPQISNNRPTICCMHSMITDDSSIMVDGRYKTINWQAVNSTADVILTGHYHPGFPIRENKFNVRFVNPGAMTRQEASKIDMNRKVQCTKIIVKDDKTIDIKYKTIPHRKDVFNIESLISDSIIEEEKNRFVLALNSLKSEDVMGGNLLDIIDKIKVIKDGDCEETISDKVLKRCKKKIMEVQGD